MIQIVEANTKHLQKLFVEFPNKLYKDNPYYVPCLSSDELSDIRPETNPAYAYCDARPILAYKDGKLAGRMCIIINKSYNEKWNKKRIRFNRFDVIDDIEVTKAMIAYAENWARERGLDEITGPIGFCDMDKEGLLVEGFNEQDMFITAYNAAYYAEHLEKLGFVKDADWIEYELKVPEQLDPRIKKVSEGILRKLKLTLLQFKSIKEATLRVDEIFALLNSAYSELYGTVLLNDGQIELYKKQFIPTVNLDYLCVIENENKEIIGFGLAIPSLAKAMKKCGGHLFPLGWLYSLRALKKNSRLELLLVAVRKDYQSKGVNAIMISHIYENAIKNGIKYAETGPELELNEKVQSQWKTFEKRQHKRRRCFVKPIDVK